VKNLAQLKSDYVVQNLTAFCPGCGNGIILNCFVRAIDDLGIDPKGMLCVSGIGCSSWIPSPHFRGDTLHTTHGRALAYATGAKAWNPDLKTVVFMGDGDGSGIGGNHLIHAARRNIDLTCILVNNLNYAMTGGQVAPSTSHMSRTATTPYGNPEQPFDIARLAQAAGATYVARWTTYHVLELVRSIKEGLQHKGFSFIEVVSHCPTQQRGILNLRAPPQEIPSRLLDLLGESTYVKDRPDPAALYAVPSDKPEDALKAVTAAGFKARLVDHISLGRVVRTEAGPDARGKLEAVSGVKYVAEPREGKLEVGVFANTQRPEYTEALRAVGRRARGEA
jgi:2-oxoglutarate ferredoxin oxidoreductase subunit beta